MPCQCCTPTTDIEPERQTAQPPAHGAEGGCGPECGCGASADAADDLRPEATEPMPSRATADATR